MTQVSQSQQTRQLGLNHKPDQAASRLWCFKFNGIGRILKA